MGKLAKIEDITPDIVKQWNLEIFNAHLNRTPPKSWVKTNKYAGGHLYVPIDKIEMMLKKFFKEHRIEILREGTSFNGVYVVVRIHYFHPITEEWEYHDGIGASELQTAKGESVANLNAINSGALAMAFPTAKSRAVRDASHHFGKIFGSDLNRKETMEYSLDEGLKGKAEERLEALIDSADSVDKLESILASNTIPDGLKSKFEDKIEELKNG